MSPSRKTLTQRAAEIEQWIAQGWLTGQETFIELQDMAMMTDLIQTWPRHPGSSALLVMHRSLEYRGNVLG